MNELLLSVLKVNESEPVHLHSTQKSDVDELEVECGIGVEIKIEKKELEVNLSNKVTGNNYHRNESINFGLFPGGKKPQFNIINNIGYFIQH